jgi:hypothetical protein
MNVDAIAAYKMILRRRFERRHLPPMGREAFFGFSQ